MKRLVAMLTGGTLAAAVGAPFAGAQDVRQDTRDIREDRRDLRQDRRDRRQDIRHQK